MIAHTAGGLMTCRVVVRRDEAVESLVNEDESGLAPLRAFRDWLAEIARQAGKSIPVNDGLMNRDMAAETIESLCKLGQEIHRPLESGTPELTPEEQSALKWSVGEVMGAIYTDLMIPVIKEHPELDPDRQSEGAPLSTLNRVVEPKSPSLAQFGCALIDAADDVLVQLEEILKQVDLACEPAEAQTYRARTHKVLRHIEAVSDLGLRLVGRSVGKA